jgi:hypothetical protein
MQVKIALENQAWWAGHSGHLAKEKTVFLRQVKIGKVRDS